MSAETCAWCGRPEAEHHARPGFRPEHGLSCPPGETEGERERLAEWCERMADRSTKKAKGPHYDAVLGEWLHNPGEADAYIHAEFYRRIAALLRSAPTPADPIDTLRDLAAYKQGWDERAAYDRSMSGTPGADGGALEALALKWEERGREAGICGAALDECAAELRALASTRTDRSET